MHLQSATRSIPTTPARSIIVTQAVCGDSPVDETLTKSDYLNFLSGLQAHRQIYHEKIAKRIAFAQH